MSWIPAILAVITLGGGGLISFTTLRAQVDEYAAEAARESARVHRRIEHVEIAQTRQQNELAADVRAIRETVTKLEVSIERIRTIQDMDRRRAMAR
jgi:hypothetical protein